MGNNINRQNASKGRPQRDQGDVSLRQGLCAIPHEHELPERCSNCYEANTRSRKESRTDCLHLSTLEPLEAKSVHRPPLLPRSVRWVCRQRRLEKISQKQLETGKDSVSPSSRGFRRPLCLVSRHQGLEGTPPRPKEGEEHQAQSITLDEVIEIARTMRFKSLSKELKGGVKEILGTAFSVGCQVDGRSPKDVSDDIESGEIEIPDE